MIAQLLWFYICTLQGGGLNRRTMDTTSSSAQDKALPPALAPTTRCLPGSPWCPQSSPSSVGAQSEQVHHYESPLADKAPLRGIYTCQLQQPLSHSTAGDQAVSRLHPLLPSTIVDWLIISLSCCSASVHLDPRWLCLLFPTCFCHNFDVVSKRGWMKRLSSVPFCPVSISMNFCYRTIHA